ncbi:cellulase family protein [Lysobacter capsici]|nr:cellulase family protein [Lysobacter capsici]
MRAVPIYSLKDGSMFRHTLLSAALAASCALLAAPAPALAADPGHFMAVQNGALVIDGQRIALPSTNMFDLLYLYINDPVRGKQKLSNARGSGFKAVRYFSSGTYSESTQLFPAVELWENPATRAQFYAAYDRMVADAAELDVKLIPALVTGWSDPTEINRPSGAACQHAPNSLPLLPGSDNRAALKAFALALVTRYRASDTVLFWELGNEFNLNAKHRNSAELCVTREDIAAYIAEMAAAIKAIDSNHLVAAGVAQEGDALMLADQPGAYNDAGDYFRLYHDIPNVDLSTVHIYEQYFYPAPSGSANMAVFLQYFKGIADSLGRPLWVGEFGAPFDQAWSDNNFHDAPMSLLLAKQYLGIDLATTWNWESREYGSPSFHPEMVRFSLDPDEDGDAIAALTYPQARMGGNRPGVTWAPMSGDADGDGRSDLLAAADRGLWQVSLMGAQPAVPGQWTSKFADNARDPAGAPFQRLAGDWDGDGKADIGAKARDGRWFVAFSDGKRYVGGAQWLSGFGSDAADPAGAPFVAISGDWNGDGTSDIGLKARDGRWYTATSNGAAFANPSLALSNFVNENLDPGGGGYSVLTGDWNGDGKTDIGAKSRDGRWFVARSNGAGFVDIAHWLSNFGSDLADPAGAPYQAITGDWNGDGKTDIGLKARDGRWFTALSTGSGFVNASLALSGFGDENLDPNNGGFTALSGDWNGDGRTDIGIKSGDGRWFVAYSNGAGFTAPALWH